MGRGLAREELEEEHAEAVDVGLLGDLVWVGDLRSPVAGHAGRGGEGADEGREAVVGDAGRVRFGEEDIGGLDVAVGVGGGGPGRVDVGDAAGGGEGNVQTGLPVERGPAGASVAWSEGHKVNDEKKIERLPDVK